MTRNEISFTIDNIMRHIINHSLKQLPQLGLAAYWSLFNASSTVINSDREPGGLS